MRRALAALALGLAVAAPSAAADTVYPVAGDEVATCVRDAGDGRLTLQAPVTRTSTPTDLLVASGDELEREAGADLGNLLQCPEVATGGGVAVIAGVVKMGNSFELRAAVRTGTDAFATPQRLATMSDYPDGSPSVAVGPRGDAVVAWKETRRGGFASERESVRVRAARLTAGPGAAFAPAEEVLPWTRQVEFESGTTDVAAGIDGAGRVVIAWALGVGTRERVSQLSKLGVSTAAPGEALTRTTLSDAAQDVSPLNVAVAPDGAALVVTTYQEQVHVFDRSAGGRFKEVGPLGGERQTPDEAAVALGADGHAVVAWRSVSYGDDERHVRVAIQAARRGPGGGFAAPTTVWSRAVKDNGSFISAALEDEVAAPLDTARLRAAITTDGATAITWNAPRRASGDRLPAAFLARGAAQGGYDVVRLGGPCRSVNGVVPLAGPGSRLGAAWTDNAAQRLDDDFEFPLGSGRLHVTGSGPPAAPTPPPRLTLPGSRRLQRLWSEDSIDVPVACDGPCDLRGFVPDGSSPRFAAGVSLHQAGRTTVELYPSLEPIGLRPETLHVVVHGCSPGGTDVASAATAVRVVRNRPPKVPPPVGLKARRSGDEIVVTWRTPFPARRAGFFVHGHAERSDESPPSTEPAVVEGRARTRFRARLRPLPGKRARYVTVGAYSTEFSRQQHTATVRVGG